MTSKTRILIYAFGNPGRQDDGLGNHLVEELEPWLKERGFDQVTTESNYQLNIEDADNIKDRDIVVFVDASIEDIDDFHLGLVEPSEGRSEFTMHAASPAFILALCIKLYRKHPETYLLQTGAMNGNSWKSFHQRPNKTSTWPWISSKEGSQRKTSGQIFLKNKTFTSFFSNLLKIN